MSHLVASGIVHMLHFITPRKPLPPQHLTRPQRFGSKKVLSGASFKIRCALFRSQHRAPLRLAFSLCVSTCVEFPSSHPPQQPWGGCGHHRPLGNGKVDDSQNHGWPFGARHGAPAVFALHSVLLRIVPLGVAILRAKTPLSFLLDSARANQSLCIPPTSSLRHPSQLAPPPRCAPPSLALSLSPLHRITPKSQGEVFICGTPRQGLVGDDPAGQLRVGMVFQSASLFDSLTVGENVGFVLYEHSDLPDDRIQCEYTRSSLKRGLENELAGVE